ncbi:MAG: hypothetical protein LBP56_04905 [Odoribacteraceae bacterium]|nr:hypothetical protein [Odoribacteraceae bacterium]
MQEKASLSVFYLRAIFPLAFHKRLFTGVENIRVKVGKVRDYNITKSEWVLPMTRFPYSISVQPVGIMFYGQFLEQIQFSLYKWLLIFHLPRPLHKPLEREDTSLLFVYLKNIGTRNDEN